MSHLPPELEMEVNMIMDLQKHLLSLSEETMESVYQFIMNSTFIHSTDRPRQLTSSLFILIEYRPWQIPYTANLCLKLLESASPTNSLSKLKPDILFTIFTKDKIKQENLHFLAHCLENHFLYPQELVDFIHQYSTDNPSYFAWFSPEIEMINPTLFEKLYNHYKPSQHETIFNIDLNDNLNNIGINNHMINDRFGDEEEEEGPELSPEMYDYFRNLETLRKNDWELLKQLRLNGCNHHKINVIIKNDDLEALQNLIDISDFDYNQTSLPSIFELSMFCQTDPTLIQVAAFYGAVKCFKYFFINGADAHKCDEEKKTTVHFAIAGGNIEIIRILQRENFNFSGAANIATIYHRNDIFRWIYDTIVNDLSMVDKYHGTLLESSCGSNNLEVFKFCMEHGANVNQKNSRVFLVYKVFYILMIYWTPIYSAIWNNRGEMVKILLYNKDLDVNAVTDQGWTALYTAALAGRTEFVNLLLQCDNINVNVKTITSGWSALFAATESLKIECVHALLSFDGIDINSTNNEGVLHHKDSLYTTFYCM
ncbi:hypothetical protein TRFO_07820 [Tritrichomonas foetus]|uniref:Uncharacterized protein n=1 Tax=Tritrichomonas foetus TaxID=1144522 RepID=A0A1J4JNV1_9EUKA|nr:hypothetical protein TRFO_07820 [Tritrichomonas foetus]|eukprot:OHT00823.1 hypothetical protein TRFO_07820 [Tritrichomonas foetus]